MAKGYGLRSCYTKNKDSLELSWVVGRLESLLSPRRALGVSDVATDFKGGGPECPGRMTSRAYHAKVHNLCCGCSETHARRTAF